MDKFLYLTESELCSGEKDAPVSKASSGYIAKYNETVVKSIARDTWKYTGASAQFQQRMPVENEPIVAAVTGLSPYSDDEYLYSVQVNDVSAILKKDLKTHAEQYIIHSNKQLFKGVDYNKEGTVATSVSDDRQTSHIATFNIENGDLNLLTSGDAVDENPFFSRKDGSILFNSKGVGRNQYMQKIGEGNSSLYKISTGYFSTCDEILSEQNFDLIAPKEDKDGNLYYIRKPYKMKQHREIGIGDLLLFPFKLFYNFFKFLFFLSRLGGKSNKKNTVQSSGDNPYVNPGQSERDVYILNEKINIEKEEKANAKKGDKNPGFAPRAFELYKMSPDGIKTKLRSGVLSYDLSNDGKVIFTNGRYILRIDDDGETVLSKDKFIANIRAN